MLETFVPNLVFITCPSLQIIGKTKTGVFPTSVISGQSLIKRNCHNSWNSDDIDMKLGQVTKLDKRNKTTSKRFEDDVIWKMTLLSFFQFTANLKYSGSQTPNAQSVKLIFPLIVTFCLVKTENRIKKSLTQLSHYGFE